MKSFTHFNAQTYKQAVKLLSKYPGKAKLIAGGTDLLGILKDKILPVYPEVLINIKTLKNQDFIKEDTKELKIGALAKLSDIADSQLIKEKYTLLSEAAESVATPQIRNMATIGGNLCQDVRCWYYRYPHQIGGRILCYLKGGDSCYALTAENRYHSIFGACRTVSPPCSSECPGTIDIPSYVGRIREGDLKAAAKILLESNPIPSITGRVCPHSCELHCNRKDIDEPVSIREIERFLGDYILENAGELIRPQVPSNGKKIAIIGTGPAGLSAAYYLTMIGLKVTLFDENPEPGGMLRYGIPQYRLPKNVVEKVCKSIENAGVEFRLKTRVGKDITFDKLKTQYDCLFIAGGAWNQPRINLEGENLTVPGLQFLKMANQGNRELPGKKILVIGGGNVAVDVGITALRLGAQKVTLACLECREEMPAFPYEITQAVSEGIQLKPSWGTSKIIQDNGKVTGVELVRCISVFNKDGVFAPVFDNTIHENVEADAVIMAVGQSPDVSFLDPQKDMKFYKGVIEVDWNTQKTGVPGVFAGGEMANGPSTVIEAVASGRRAARAIESLFQEAGLKTTHKTKETASIILKFNNTSLNKVPRSEPAMTPILERTVEVEDTQGLNLHDAKTETNRCFNCGCVAVHSSDLAVALIALDATIKIKGIKGFRKVKAEEYFSIFRYPLGQDEIVAEIQVPRLPEKALQTFIKFRLRSAIDFPIVSVASLITIKGKQCRDARIVLGAVAPVPVRATEAERLLRGKVIDSNTAEMAAAAALKEAIPLGDNAYKVEIAKTLIKRAILTK